MDEEIQKRPILYRLDVVLQDDNSYRIDKKILDNPNECVFLIQDKAYILKEVSFDILVKNSMHALTEEEIDEHLIDEQFKKAVDDED